MAAIDMGVFAPAIADIAGWKLRYAYRVTMALDSRRDYIRSPEDECRLCKNDFAATNSGYFNGRGLLTDRNVDKAAAANERIRQGRESLSRQARETVPGDSVAE